MRFAAGFTDRLQRELRGLNLDRPVAEIARDLCSRAEALDLPRPSYAAVRLHVEQERIRRAERDAAIEVGLQLALSRHIAPGIQPASRAYNRARERRLRG